MMITLRKLPLAVAVAAGVMSAPALKVNTVLVTNVKPMRN